MVKENSALTKVSIIVPVYNVGQYLGRCIESLINQTLRDIEIICINDASTDDSCTILDRYKEKDDRIRIIDFEENAGTLCARIAGVQKAAGQFIMFVDSDDYLEINACEELYRIITQRHTDCVHFGTQIHVGDNVSDDMKAWVENFLIPYEGDIKDISLVDACFTEDRFDFNITNKIWKADICKKAFSKVATHRLVASEDRYIFYVLMYYCSQYYGITQKYYNYNLGIGVTGGDILDLPRFEKRCSGAEASVLVREFLEKEGKLEKYAASYSMFSKKILWDCVDCWHNKLRREDFGEGFKVLQRYFAAPELSGAVARVYFEETDDIFSRAMLDTGKRVAIYYRYLGYDNMDLVVYRYVQQFKRQGYDVVIYTDKDRVDMPLTQEYDIRIEYLENSATANWDKYEARAYDLYNRLVEDKIDTVLYASPTSHIYNLDILLLSLMGISVIDVKDEIYLDEYGKKINELTMKLEQENSRNLEMRSKLDSYEAEFASPRCMVKRLIASIKYKLTHK